MAEAGFVEGEERAAERSRSMAARVGWAGLGGV
jgi:hypothetical protein